MPSQIFLNLPISDLSKSVSLYKAIGFEINPQFSDDEAACMVWNESIFVMLLTHNKFYSFTKKPIANVKNFIAGIYAMSVESIDKMNQICDAAIQQGASEPKPLQDHGFMQLRTIEDYDGHTWEIFFTEVKY
jgi:uncharacterized protein